MIAERVQKLIEDPERLRLFREALRGARSAVLADAEGFMAVVAAIEQLGKWLMPGADGLGKSEPGLNQLVEERCDAQTAERFARELCVLRLTRNDAAHSGVAARHATSEALRVCLVLEEALTVNVQWQDVTATDLMSRGVAEAKTWQLVHEARRMLLVNGFTWLPIRVGGHWKLLSDHALASWLNVEPARRKARLTLELQAAIADGLDLASPMTVSPDVTVPGLASAQRLVLVTADGGDTDERLLGVISPADLL